MSIEFFDIKFSIDSRILVEALEQYVSKRKKSNCELQLEENTVRGYYYSSEYDSDYDSWEPSKKLPGGVNATKWFLDVMHHGLLIKRTGEKQIAKKLNALEESLEAYSVTYCKCSPQGLNYVCYQTCDGETITSYEMSSYGWECLWDSGNRKEAKEIFDKHGLDMDSYKVSESFIGDTFSSLKDEPVFIELLESFGEKTTETRIVGDEEAILQVEIEDLLASLNKSVVSPESIEYSGKKVGLSIYDSSQLKQYTSWGDRLRLRYFVESSLRQLGATYSGSDFGVNMDISILIRNHEHYSTDYYVCKYYNINEVETVTFVYGGDPIRKRNLTDKEYHIGQLAVFKNYLEKFQEELNLYNTKRLSRKKPLEPIRVVFEDEWFNYLMELDKDPAYHQERQKIAEEMVHNSPYVGGDQSRIDAVYNARPEGRDFDL